MCTLVLYNAAMKLKTVKHSSYTEKAIQVIDDYWMRFLKPPTYRDIQAGLMCSLNTVSYVLGILEDEGYIEKQSGSQSESRNVVPKWVREAIDNHKKFGK